LIRRGEIDYLCIRSAEIIPRVYDATFRMVIFGEPEVVKSIKTIDSTSASFSYLIHALFYF